MARCKYEREQRKVSYDSGTTWVNFIPETYRKGQLIESPSSDCEEETVIYRWRVLYGTYICDGDTKYEREVQDESYDNGATWYVSYPSVYRKGTLIGEDSEYCADKFVGHYIPGGDKSESHHSCPVGYFWNGYTCVSRHSVDPLKIVRCESNTTLTSDDTYYYDPYNWALFNAELGNCVTAIGGSAFSGRTSLSSVTMQNSVTSIGTSAFTNCDALTSITIPTSVESIGDYAFYDCNNLSRMNSDTNGVFNIPSGVKTIGDYAFVNCKSINAVNVPSGVTSIGNGAFRFILEHDYSLTSLTIEEGSHATIGDSCFIGISTLANVNLPNGITSIGEKAFESCTGLQTITIPSGSIGIYSFRNCQNLTAVTLGNGVTSIGYGAFRSCFKIKNIAIPGNVTSIGGEAFSWCTGLTSVTMQNSVTSIGASAFTYCTGLTSINIPDSVTSVGDSLFDSCESLSNVSIGRGLTSLSNNMFSYCSGLVSVGTAGSGAAVELPDTLTTIGGGSFRDCRSLSSVTIPNSVTTIGGYAFNYCTGLTSCVLGNGVETIGERAFRYCSSLTNIDIPSSVTSIGSGSFSNCTGLTSATIGTGITTFEQGAFWGCSGLTSITINATTPPTLANANAFDYTNDCPIYVPCESLEVYKAATGWSGLASRLTASYSQITRITSGTPYCIGFDKYVDVYNQLSNDCGETWQTISTTATLLETNSSDCGYVPLTVANVYVTNTSTPTKIANDTSGINKIVIDDIVQDNVSTGYTFTRTGTHTVKYAAPNIGDYAFQDCTSLTNVSIPDSVTSIGYNAFYQSNSLQSVIVNAVIPPTLGSGAFDATNNCTIYVPCTGIGDYWDEWSNYAGRIVAIENICNPSIRYRIGYNDGSEVKKYCGSGTYTITTNDVVSKSNITGVTLGDCLTAIGNQTFSNASNLTGIDIPDSVTSIGSAAFYHCSGMTSCTIGNGVTTIGVNAFNQCVNLTSVVIPDSVTSIGEDAFRYCSGLTSATLSNSITKIKNTFGGCTGLTSIVIPSGVTSIDGGFSACWSLTSITFAENSQLEGISGMCSGCRSLTSIDIPSGVTFIQGSSFRDCSGLTSITIRATVPPEIYINASMKDPFYNTGNCPIYVPAESVDIYKATGYWYLYYSNRIQPIPE